MVSPDEPVRKNSKPQARKRIRTKGFNTENAEYTEKKKQSEFIFGKSSENTPGAISRVDRFFLLLRPPYSPIELRIADAKQDSFVIHSCRMGRGSATSA